jgi:hypothetical protein
MLLLANASFAQHHSPFGYNEENFAFEVKQIDEFIERFDNRSNTLLKEYLKTNYPTTKIERAGLIKGLFNQSDTTWNAIKVNEFITDVTNPSAPVFLSFYDKDWFAEVNCQFVYHGKNVKGTLILQVQPEKDYSSKWVITGIKADFLQLPSCRDSAKSLNPISHGTDFLGLDRALSDKENILNYFSRDYKNDLLTAFIYELKSDALKFKQVNNITYHFLQVDGWIFTIEQFVRNSRNSGWLISTLTKAGAEKKEKYKKDVLKIE